MNIHQQTSNGSMGSEGTTSKTNRELPRFLCLHGFRTSGAILKKQIFDKWPIQVVDKLDLVFADAPFPSQGKSDVDAIFDPPYYEWYQFNKGALLSGALPGLQDTRLTQQHWRPKAKLKRGLYFYLKSTFLAILDVKSLGSGTYEGSQNKISDNNWRCELQIKPLTGKAYSSAITCPSIHVLGERDFLKTHGMDLLESYVDPVVIHHPEGHTIPRFDEKGLESMLSFIEKVQAEINK